MLVLLLFLLLFLFDRQLISYIRICHLLVVRFSSHIDSWPYRLRENRKRNMKLNSIRHLLEQMSIQNDVKNGKIHCRLIQMGMAGFEASHRQWYTLIKYFQIFFLSNRLNITSLHHIRNILISIHYMNNVGICISQTHYLFCVWSVLCIRVVICRCGCGCRCLIYADRTVVDLRSTLISAVYVLPHEPFYTCILTLLHTNQPTNRPTIHA